MSNLLLITVFCILGAFMTNAEVTMEDAVNMGKKAAEECMKEVGASSSDLDGFANGKPSSSMEGMCLRSCLLQKFDIMDSNGKLNREVILGHAKMFTKDDAAKIKVVTEMLDACLSIDVSSNVCEATEEYVKCYKNEATARGIEKLEF